MLFIIHAPHCTFPFLHFLLMFTAKYNPFTFSEVNEDRNSPYWSHTFLTTPERRIWVFFCCDIYSHVRHTLQYPSLLMDSANRTYDAGMVLIIVHYTDIQVLLTALQTFHIMPVGRIVFTCKPSHSAVICSNLSSPLSLLFAFLSCFFHRKQSCEVLWRRWVLPEFFHL